MDSTALCALLDARQHLSGQCHSLIVVVASGRMRRLFEITGLETVFAFEDTLQDAVHRAGRRDAVSRRLAS
jgi:anti-anti-sigma factor